MNSSVWCRLVGLEVFGRAIMLTRGALEKLLAMKIIHQKLELSLYAFTS